MATDNLPQAICPILTAAVMARPLAAAETARVVGIGAPVGRPDVVRELEAIACQGPSCQWFMSQQDASGKVVGGQCAATAAVIALSNLSVLLSKFTQPKEP